MKPKRFFILSAIIISLTFSQTIFAQNNQSSLLTVGDIPSELKISQWLKGGGFMSFEKGKVYLIDLWATWCVPCIAGMPHLSALQTKYKAKGLEVIGITNEDKYGNSLENVQNFIRKKDSIIRYNVAWVPVSIKDSLQGIWLHPWMQESGSGNLPTAFLIDKNGKMAYIGDPFTIDETLDAVMNDHYDINELKTNYEDGINAEKTLSQFNSSIKSKNYKDAIGYGKHLLSDFKHTKPNTYLVMGWQVAQIETNIDPELMQIGYEAAIRGVELTRFESPGFLDVLASIYSAKKDYVSAVITEKLAVSLSEGGMKEN